MKNAIIVKTIALLVILTAGSYGLNPIPGGPDKTNVGINTITRTGRVLLPVTRVLLDESALRNAALPADRAAVPRWQEGIRFTENRGQVADTDGRVRNDILFIADAPGARLYLRSNGISYVFTESVSPFSETERGSGQRESVSPLGEIERGSESYRMDMVLLGSNPAPRIHADGELPGYSNFYLPHCPDGITGVRQYSRLVYENVYDNIDFELFSSGGRVKYNFVVRPGGRPDDILMRYNGALDAAVTQEGRLTVVTPLGRVEEAAPYTYCGIEGNEVPSRFLRSGNTVSFEVAEYDAYQTLVIDPWATYYGGSALDEPRGVSVDANGNVIVAGYTESINLPVSVGSYQQSSAGSSDAFIVKFDANGSRLWATYYGGSSAEDPRGVAIDANGNVVFAGGTSSTNFPVSGGAFQVVLSGGGDAFVVKLDGNGSRIWATYYGGSADDFPLAGVACDGSNNIYFAGGTYSGNFPVTAGSFQTSKGQGNGSDAFLVKLNANGGRVWATYYGGKQSDHARAIAAFGSDVYFSGETMGSFPVSTGAFQTVYAGSKGLTDAFLVKMNASGGRVWATYCGGSGVDYGSGVATDPNGNVILSGQTNSVNFPVTAGAFQTTNGGGYDAYVAKFNASGTRQWSTYVGGSGLESLGRVACDANANIILSTSTTSTNFPVSMGSMQTVLNGTHDACLVKLLPNGMRDWATYYGGSGAEPYSVYAGTDANGNIAVAGSTTSSDLPLSTPFQSTNAGNRDAFVAMLSPSGRFFKPTEALATGPECLALQQNYPNPFSLSTTIVFGIPEDGTVRLNIFDAHGRMVSQLVNGDKTGGRHGVAFEGRHLPSGLYLIVLEQNGRTTTRVMTLMK